MQITRATLEKHRDDCASKIAGYTGVLQFVDVLIEQLDTPEPEELGDHVTVDDLEKMTGAKFEGITPTKPTKK